MDESGNNKQLGSRVGANRELKKALESCWAGKSSSTNARNRAKAIRRENG